MNPEAVLYVRVSSKEQEEGFSLDDMVSDCIDRCDTRGWPVSVIKRDSLPGGFRNRPALKEALAALVPGKSVFVTWSINRLGRDAAYNWEIIRQIREDYNCAFSSVTEDIDLDTSSGRLLFGVKSLLAQHENEQRAERIRRAVLGLAERGRFSGGNPAYGYRMKPLGKRQGCTLEIDKATAPTVRLMFSWIDVEGIGIRTVARRLNDRKILSPTGVAWHVSSVKAIVENPVYAGYRAIRKKSTSRFSAQGNRLSKPFRKDQWQLFPGEHPALIKNEQWERVQEILMGRTHHARPSRHDYFLTGILRCQCGAVMVAHAGYTRQGKYYPRYMCYARRSPQEVECRNPSTAAEPLEQAVISALRARSRSKVPWHMEAESYDPNEAIRTQIDNVTVRQDNLLKALEAGHLDSGVYAERSKQLAARAKELQRELKAPKKAGKAPRVEFRNLADLLESPEVSLPRKRVALQEVFNEIVWENGGLKLVYRRPASA